MRCITRLGPLLLAVLLPAYAAAQDNRTPSVLAQADKEGPAQKTETKPFNPHAAHPAKPSTKPWFDLTGLPPQTVRPVSAIIVTKLPSQTRRHARFSTRA